MGFDLNSLDTAMSIVNQLRKLNPQDVRNILEKASQASLDAAGALSRISKVADNLLELLKKINPDEPK